MRQIKSADDVRAARPWRAPMAQHMGPAGDSGKNRFTADPYINVSICSRSATQTANAIIFPVLLYLLQLIPADLRSLSETIAERESEDSSS